MIDLKDATIRVKVLVIIFLCLVILNLFFVYKHNQQKQQVDVTTIQPITRQSIKEGENLFFFENSTLTENIKLVLGHAKVPFENYQLRGAGASYSYIKPETKESFFLIPKHTKEYLPLLGTPSHFYPFEGSPIFIEQLEENELSLAFIGFKINDLNLIDNFKIEFKHIVQEEYPPANADIGFLGKLIPKACACGPYFHYETLGESELELDHKSGEIYWFKPKNEIKIDPEMTWMQIYYLPGQKGGELSVQVGNMIFQGQDNQLYNPTILEGLDGEDLSRHSMDYVYEGFGTGDKYLAYLAKEEKGIIKVKQNLSLGTLDIIFANQGEDSILIDDKTFRAIENIVYQKEIKGFMLQESENENVLHSLSISAIKNELIGKRIDPGQELRMPFVSIMDIQKGTIYSCMLSANEKEERFLAIDNVDQKRIIKWIIGRPYIYFSDDESFCRLYLKNDGSLAIDER